MIEPPWNRSGNLRRRFSPRANSVDSGGPPQTAVNALRHALRNPPCNVGPPEAGFAIADFNNSGFIFKESADGLLA